MHSDSLILSSNDTGDHGRRRLATRAAVALALAFALSACSGSGGGGSADTATQNPAPSPAPVTDCGSDPAACGEVYIGLTDADGDFLSYTVGVESLTLERADGAIVETMPRSAVVDFAAYTELTEFLSVATVPPGTYVSGSLVLDFTDAEVFVEKDGQAVPATVSDEAGNPLTRASFTVRLSERDRLVVRRGRPAVMEVDFDLEASHKVDLDADPVQAYAQPFLLADIDPVETKTIRVRGPLVEVGRSEYTVALRPFRLRDGNFGQITVHTADTTAFEIDGRTYVGAEGLDVLAAQPQGTATIATGVLDVAARRYEAEQVFAGTSVPGGDLDVLTGHVIGRSGDRLLVYGATWLRADGSAQFSDAVSVTISDLTTVVKAGDPAFDGGIGAISVGQWLTVFGNATRPADVDSADASMDASDGRVRLLPTRMSGIVTVANTGLLTVDLAAIGGRNPERFDFAGTGFGGDDADPDAYEVTTGNLPLAAVTPGSPVRYSGFVAPFGLAPPDFDATTVVDYGDTRARLAVEWLADATDPFLVVDVTGIVPNLDETQLGDRHWLRRGGIRQDLADLEPPPVVVGRDDGRGLYAIRQTGTVQIYTDFADFTAALATALGEGNTVAGFHASGGYADADGLFTARRIAVRLD